MSYYDHNKTLTGLNSDEIARISAALFMLREADLDNGYDSEAEKSDELMKRVERQLTEQTGAA